MPEILQPSHELCSTGAYEVANRAEDKAREFLGRHADWLAPALIDAIAKEEYRLALYDYKERRIAGRANDQGSEVPGLTAYLTVKGKESAVAEYITEDDPIPDDLLREVTRELWEFNLPEGVYFTGGGGIQFYMQADPDFRRNGKCNRPFYLDYDDVVRIEGSQNKLWQNVDYHWDGTPKAPVSSKQ